MRHALFAAAAAGLLCLPAAAQGPRPGGDPAPDARILENRNLTAAGSLQGGVLTVRLEVRRGIWYPQADDGPALPVYAFAEEGKALTNPGPMIRVTEGTPIRVRVRNRLDSAVVVHGLVTRPGGRDSVVVPARGTAEVSFRVDEPGTYYYWGSTTGLPVEERDGPDSQLTGALVVDPRGGSAADRVFVLGLWFQPPDAAAGRPLREALVINGKSWPHNEILTLPEGESVRWRWINSTSSSHPMHLHGFYFAVGSRGDWMRDTVYEAGRRPLAVTELMPPGGTYAMEWVPERPGNWVFHCHFAFHVMNTMEAPDTSEHARHQMHDMSGLVLGLHVTPRPGPVLQPTSAAAPHRIRLLVNERARYFRDRPGMGFVVQEGAEPATDSIVLPGPMLVLEQGRPVAITVVNRLREPTGVHWHGLEIPSFPDGVPNWSGSPGNVMAPVMPGDSFVAEFTPPRAGTFMYHAHANEQRQINSGLYGALIVLPPGRRMDPERDRLVLVGGAGPPDEEDNTTGLVNGSRTPPPMDLVAGTTYRLRLVNIHPEWRVRFTLQTDSTVERWSLVAKDGADTAPWERPPRVANLVTGPGETADFEWTPPRAGTYRLHVATFLPGWHIPVVLRVRPDAPN